jgi:spectinomycin phosphotransferase
MYKVECTMKTPPPANDLDPAWIAGTLATAWDLPPVSLVYRPVGFGSHHWLAEATGDGRRWFVTADNLRERPEGGDRLRRAMRVAWLLRHDVGIAEVVAPLATPDGQVLSMLAGGRWAIAVFPCLPLEDPGDGAFATEESRLAAQRLVARIHASTALLPNGLAPVDAFAISRRKTWHAVIARVDAPWGAGPYADPARALLRASARLVEDGFARYDALVAEVRRDASRWVITHGEPHAANIVARGDGAGLAIVDWDTVAFAPKERDLWQLLSTSGSPEADLVAYFDALPPGGERTISASAISLYRLRWVLYEIALYAEWFANPHDDSEDMRIGWQDLADCLESLDRQLTTG